MFAAVARFEFRYQLRQPVFWTALGVFFLLTFGSITVDQVQIGTGGPIHKNAPYAVAVTHLILSVFFMFVTTAFVANVVLRDDDTGFAPILRSTRLGKRDYLLGRFAGAFAAVALCFLVAVPLALILGSIMPWVDPETLGPVTPAPYLFAYGVLALPNLLLTASLFFMLATTTRSMMGTYVAAVAFLLIWIVAGAMMRGPPFDTVAAWWDPLGRSSYALATRYWTMAERNTLVPPLAGALLVNRLFVLALSGAFLAAALAAFRFEAAARPVKPRPIDEKADAAPPLSPIAAPLPSPVRLALAQGRARLRLELAQVLRHPAFLILMALGAANAGVVLWFSTQTPYGGDIWPVTRLMIQTLRAAFGLIPFIVAVFYAGELVWRDRDRRMHEIIDAAPLPEWAFIIPKAAAVFLVLLATHAVGALTAVAFQLARGWLHPALGEYLVWYVLPGAADAFLVAVLAVFLQALAPHKFIGWGLMALLVIGQLVLENMGYSHVLYVFGATPPVPLSDMNGQGRFWIGAWWLRAYWGAFCLVLLVLAHGLWRRGEETRLAPRLKRLPRRLRGPAAGVLAVALAALIGCGLFVFHNTNRLNDYRSRQDDERWAADYEKALLAFETTPQPKIAAVRLEMDIRPKTPSLRTQGLYVLENRTGAPLRQVHVRFPRDLAVEGLSIQGARPVRTYERFNYRIFAFDTPMAPLERRSLSFTTTLEQRGFSSREPLVRVVKNGTFVNDQEIAPRLGMDRGGLLQDRAARRRNGLAPQLRPPPLGDVPSRQVNVLRHDADWVSTDVTVSTDADQTPVAPGLKVSDVTQGGRRTARFVSTAPVMDFISGQSARYQTLSRVHDGVTLSVLHDRAHAMNAPRMIDAMAQALDYCRQSFGPYRFGPLKVAEAPAYSAYAQSYPGVVPWSEGLGFIADGRDRQKIDYVTYVGAHETAHQWWGHQLVAADQQGASALSETLAQYSALMVMEKAYGQDQIRKFLKFELDRYLRARGGEAVEEPPLVRVENQPYIHYQKGALVMYRLRQEMGEAAVNRALRALLARYGAKPPPYANAADLVAALRTQARPDQQDLITDLFEKITLYDLRAVSVRNTRRPDGRYDVAVTVTAQKLYADGQGRQRPAPLNEVMAVGAFDAEPGKKGFKASDVAAMQRLAIRSGRQTLILVSDRPARFAGVDPYNSVIDRNSDDNLIRAQ